MVLRPGDIPAVALACIVLVLPSTLAVNNIVIDVGCVVTRTYLMVGSSPSGTAPAPVYQGPFKLAAKSTVAITAAGVAAPVRLNPNVLPIAAWAWVSASMR